MDQEILLRVEELVAEQTNAERQDHVTELAELLTCEVVQKPGMAGMMFVEYEPPMIEGPVIQEQKDYFIMLHELGHVAHGHTQGRPPFTDKRFYFDNGVLKSEAEAWMWALDNSREEPCQATRNFMWNFCLGSYLRGSVTARGRLDQLWNGNRHHVVFLWDKPDELFWSSAERLAGENVEAINIAKERSGIRI